MSSAGMGPPAARSDGGKNKTIQLNNNSHQEFKDLSLREALNFYQKEGLNLLPVRPDKKPALKEWKHLQERKATDEEINEWFPRWNIGVICGTISDNLFIIDFDDPELFDRFFPKKDGLVFVRTGREGGGFHVWYKADHSVKTLKVLDDAGREVITLKGEGGYAIAPPSRHESGREYAFVQQGKIPRLEGDPREDVIRRAYDLGLKPEGDNPVDIEKLLKGVPQGNRDNALVQLITFLKKAGRSSDEQEKLCLTWNERNSPPLSESAVLEKVRYHSNREAYEYFFNLDPTKWQLTENLTLEEKGKKKKKKTEDVIFTPSIEDGTRLLEEIYRDGQALFIDGDGTTYETCEVDGIKYAPVIGDKQRGDELTEGAVLLPSGMEDYEDEKALIDALKAHIHRYVDVSPFFETISAYYILLSWLYDELSTLPYLRALGDTGTGKSRFLDVVGRLCYRATMVAGAITPAPIYRLIRRWHGTIVIDEGDFRASDEQNEVVKILNCGFERGRPVVRSTKDQPDNLQILPTFGPKLISSRRRFKDVALESRCLTEIMKETGREDIPYLLPKRFHEEEARLRNQLLAFRFKNHGTVDIEKAQALDGVDIENRLKQAVSSFVVLFANNKTVFDEFKSFLLAYNADLVQERAATYEGAMVAAIFDKVPCLTDSYIHGTLGTIGTLTNGNLEDVKITPKDISDLLIEKYGYEKANPRAVGKVLRTLGIETKQKKIEGEKRRVLVLDASQLLKLRKKYIPKPESESTNGEKSTMTMGDREETVPSKNICDQCGEDAKTCLLNGEQLCENCYERETSKVEFLPDIWLEASHES